MLVVRKAVIADAERVSLLITELGYPTNDDARRNRLASGRTVFSMRLHLTSEWNAAIVYWDV